MIIVGPPNIAPNKEAEYEAAAKDVAEGGSGYLPNGSTATTSDGPRGVNPFREHLRHLQEQLILAGTGGLLTMLTQSGSGTLAGNAHQETFDLIARAEAQKISERFQESLDAEVLETNFPGKPQLAYFDLAGGDQVDPGDVIDQVQKLSIAGYRVDDDEVSEKTGYQVVPQAKPDPDLDPQAKPGPYAVPGQGKPGPYLRNRAATMGETLMVTARDLVAKAVATDLQPLVKRLERILQIEDPELLRSKLEALKAELPQILKDINGDPAAAKVMADTFSAALLNGVEAARQIKNRRKRRG